jgi:hypothetical protein
VPAGEDFRRARGGFASSFQGFIRPTRSIARGALRFVGEVATIFTLRISFPYDAAALIFR